MKASNRFCKFHGGDISDGNEWLCDTCARQGINKCICGGHARIFGEGLASAVSCEDCDQSVGGIGVDAKALWNSGVRGWQK